MGSRAFGLAAALVLVVASGGAVAWARQDLEPTSEPVPEPVSQASAAPSVPDGPPVVTGTVVHVESGVRTTRFLPLGPAPDDALSAQHAFNALVQSASKLSPIPASVHPYYGVLTDASASPRAVDLNVWAFAATGGCVRTGVVPPPGGRTAAPSPQRRCRIWEFVNARSGHALGVMAQEVLPD